ncbi:MAG: hypothetical protein KDC38_06900 [Planctomycetes bacterium]|nr:hypothetical protein [Planctomycetota bacterium]
MSLRPRVPPTAGSRNVAATPLTRTLAVVALVAFTGCVAPTYSPVKCELDRAMVFVEQSGDQWVAHSDRSEVDPRTLLESDRPATCRPNPGQVDVDSTIHLAVRRDRLRPSLGEPLPGGERAALAPPPSTAALDRELDAVARRRGRLNELLEAVESLVTAREEALRAWTRSDAEFEALRRAFGEEEATLIDRLEEIDAARFDEIDAMAETDESSVHDGIRRWLQDETRALEESSRSLEREIGTRRVTLRVEAWLEGTPVHVPDYDTLDEGRVRPFDRWGLDLDPDERARLEAELRAVVDVARRANQVLRGEKQLVEALAETLSRRWRALADEAREWREKLDPDTLKRRRDDLRTASRRWLEEVRQESGTLTDEGRAALDRFPDEFVAWLRREQGSIATLLTTISEIDALCARWAEPRFADLPALIADSFELAAAIEQFDWTAFVTDARASARAFIAEESREWEAHLRAAIDRVLSAPAGAAFLEEIEAAQADLRGLHDFATRVVDEIRSVSRQLEGERRPLVSVPESLEIPIGEVRDTEIDIRRTDREEGDLLSVRSTLTRDGTPISQSTAQFEVRRFGAYAKLSPAVVLARPDRLRGSDDDFRFAPTLSWLHHYAPRNHRNLLRLLQPAIGVHAAFLNFDSEDGDPVQIGVGGTVSLWNGRIQAGVGINLMANSPEDGQVYYFVGTDLIGLLQQVGIVE